MQDRKSWYICIGGKSPLSLSFDAFILPRAGGVYMSRSRRAARDPMQNTETLPYRYICTQICRRIPFYLYMYRLHVPYIQPFNPHRLPTTTDDGFFVPFASGVFFSTRGKKKEEAARNNARGILIPDRWCVFR